MIMSRVVEISLILLCSAASAPLGPNENPRFGYNTRPDFIAFDASYRDKKNAAGERLRKLQAELVAQQRRGRKTPCLRQVFMEARWLVHDTADWARINAKLDDFEARLRAPKDPHDGSQVEAD